MAENTKIEWCDHTFNPWIGCQKVSPACDHCYAEEQNARFTKKGEAGNWGPKALRRRTAYSYWNQPVKWDSKAAETGTRQRVFCGSMCDIADNAVPQEWRDDLAAVIKTTPHLDWLLLTKRPQNLLKLYPADVLASCWIGTTVENQAEADRRIPALLATPAKLRFLSCEPLLGPVDLGNIPYPSPPEDSGRRGSVLDGHEVAGMVGNCIAWIPPIDWVICGGESGPHARPMHPDWARGLRDQCQAAGVPFFFKQWGEYTPGETNSDGEMVWFTPHSQRKSVIDKLHRDCERDEKHNDDSFWKNLHEFDSAGAIDHPEGGPIPAAYRVGKKKAGRLLDGAEHNAFPEAA